MVTTFANCWPCHTLILLLWSLWHGQWKWGTVHFLAPSGALYVMMRYCQSAALQLKTTRTTTKKCRKRWQCMQVAMDRKGHNTQLNASIFIRWRSVPKSPDALVSDRGFPIVKSKQNGQNQSLYVWILCKPQTSWEICRLLSRVNYSLPTLESPLFKLDFKETLPKPSDNRTVFH